MKMRIAIAGIAASLAACSAANTPVTSETIGRVRILAVRADPPSIHAGDALTLSALVVSPDKNDPDITITWYRCQHPDFETCVKSHDLLVLGHGESVSVTVPAQLTPGDVDVYWIDAVKGGEVERALKAIPVISATDPANHNPDFSRVAFAATLTQPDATTLKVNERLPVHAILKDGASDFFFDSNENAAEDIQINTFTSGGFLVDPSGTGASGEIYYDAGQVKGTFGAWVVANDGRGGVDWRSAWFDVLDKKGN